MEAGKSVYELDLDNLKTSDNLLEVGLINTETAVRFKLKLAPIQNDIMRLQIEEETPLRPRFNNPFILDKDPLPLTKLVNFNDRKNDE